ncbi:MAG: hypothetical protein ACRDQZ_17365 [Mycobacteriales bacterium]
MSCWFEVFELCTVVLGEHGDSLGAAASVLDQVTDHGAAQRLHS